VPKYHWQARTARGQEMSGDLEARSKEDAMSRLRSQSFTVTSIEEKRTRGEPEDPDRLMPHNSPLAPPSGERVAPTEGRGRVRGEPRRFLAVVVALLFLGAAVAVFKIAVLFSVILGAIGVLFLLMAIFTRRLYEIVETAEKRRKSHRM